MILRLSKPESDMLDLIFLVGGTAFFVLSAGYALICGRL